MKILQIMPTMGHGGIAMMMKMYAEEMAKYNVVFDFLHHGHEEDFHNDLRQLGSAFFCLESPGKIGWNKYTRDFQEVVKEHGPYDAIHINMNYQSGRYAKIAKRLGIENRIIHVHGVNFYHKYTRLLMPIIKLEIRRYGTVFCADSSQCGKYYYDKNNYSIIPVAIETSLYKDAYKHRKQVRDNLNLGENDFAIGHIAAFYEVKNHQFDVQLLKTLVEKASKTNYKLIFAGDGPLRQSIEQQFREQHLDSNVVFLGNIDYIPELFSALDATILPSFSEGLGQVLIQSQLSGVPCFASDTLPRESDMRIGIAEYLPIMGMDAYNRWADAIRNKQNIRLTFEECKTGVDKAGYSIETAAKKLLNIYSEG